ncbi:hypothetical protein ONS95_012598 [Cadophora gregata]|uniref:uncharacterized protein n=1 Tax=Cadophora gregata TaxID=51156 RepID=UPI0026DC7E99|nr:uncharacterized protein ONS95_012598 [Cadophora gregata]KAK0118304.1 hypothetical protein ONS95_012598 [Cadophora gregata]KAK0123371.1 hypothetical protein ONS96_010363 [Cadophora gregata f. sp. sojae]
MDTSPLRDPQLLPSLMLQIPPLKSSDNQFVDLLAPGTLFGDSNSSSGSSDSDESFESGFLYSYKGFKVSAVWGSAPSSPQAFEKFRHERIASLYEQGQQPTPEQLFDPEAAWAVTRESYPPYRPGRTTIDVESSFSREWETDSDSASDEDSGSGRLLISLNNLYSRSRLVLQWQFLNHLTISKDETQGSKFSQELLCAVDERLKGYSTPLAALSLTSRSRARGDQSPGSSPVPRSELDEGDVEVVKVTDSESEDRTESPASTHQTYYERLTQRASPPTIKFPAHTMATPTTSYDSNLNQANMSDELDETVLANCSFGSLIDRIKLLDSENRALKVKNAVAESTATTLPQQKPAMWVTLYNVFGSTCIGEPDWIKDERGIPALKKNLPLKDKERYLDRHPDICFVLVKDYLGAKSSSQKKSTTDEEEISGPPEPTKQWIEIETVEMVEALMEFKDKAGDLSKQIPNFELHQPIYEPDLFFYHCLLAFDRIMEELSPSHQALMKLFRECIEQNHGEEYRRAGEEFEKGTVSRKTMKYLVSREDVLVGQRDHQAVAYMVRAPGEVLDSSSKTRGTKQSSSAPLSSEGEKETVSWNFKCWSWDFDGNFEKRKSLQTINLVIAEDDEKVDISSLNLYPLKYASEETKELLKRRGSTFWKCRDKLLVSYQARSEGRLPLTVERFMIDISTYKTLHKDTSSYTMPCRDDMGTEVMAQQEPPDDNTRLLFPSKIKGYHMRLKKWMDLEVDQISDVVWNPQAFESLVTDEESKELIQALVTNQLEAEKSTDLISGKGNGLIILLHGGPGTGKTFTAETVAEIATKPLYRVTCGDIGTEPVGVEKYLESVLHLGKIWDCVVLLDEADVFLEERNMGDLQRNALVSVFLRVLEYYDGILILTSNRVGTFDEAFMSRIQLSLHYESLNFEQRQQIWRNFLQRLKTMHEPNIDHQSIDNRINDLAREELNGRQIRNVITTGRQLAQYRGKEFGYEHLRHVIKIATKFDNYLKGMSKGMTGDQVAKDSGIR